MPKAKADKTDQIVLATFKMSMGNLNAILPMMLGRLVNLTETKADNATTKELVTVLMDQMQTPRAVSQLGARTFVYNSARRTAVVKRRKTAKARTKKRRSPRTDLRHKMIAQMQKDPNATFGMSDFKRITRDAKAIGNMLANLCVREMTKRVEPGRYKLTSMGKEAPTTKVSAVAA